MKYLVVGAGFSGATLARCLAENGHTVEVIDQKSHVGGHAYDYTNSQGIRVHLYGPHLFHTSNDEVFAFLSRFTSWVEYEHKVVAELDSGAKVPFPPNAYTKSIVDDVVETFYRPYTRKMWGKELEEVAPQILDRVPGRDDYEDRYFPNDTYQFLPEHGYTQLIKNMLDHENIRVFLDMCFLKTDEQYYDHVFNSMPIDEYYKYEHGKLDYRSIKFHTVNVPMPQHSVFPVINFTHDGPFTRMTEWKNFPGHGENEHWTTLTVEEPCDYKDNDMQRYYPVNDAINKERYKLYKSIPNEKVTFIGRTGQYVYIDMHQAVNSSLRLAMDYK
jgi:UDP-galactopyranose mutase